MNILTTTVSFLKRLRAGVSQDPIRDWLMLITLSAIALTGIVVWNMWAFDTATRGGVIGTPSPEAQPIFNGTSLDAIHTIFADRAAEEAKYVTGVYHFADPSQ